LLNKIHKSVLNKYVSDISDTIFTFQEAWIFIYRIVNNAFSLLQGHLFVTQVLKQWTGVQPSQIL